MADSKLRDLSTDFAVKVIKMCDSIKGHYSLVNQLERSSTSIGANIHEANYAHSKADFVAKFQIALKECYETEYWLELFVKSELLDREVAKDLCSQCGTIRRMLISSINTAKENIISSCKAGFHSIYKACLGSFCPFKPFLFLAVKYKSFTLYPFRSIYGVSFNDNFQFV